MSHHLCVKQAVTYGSVCFLGFWHRFQLFGVWGSELGIDAMCIDHLVHCYSGVPISCRLELGAVRWGPLAFESLGLTQRFPYRGDPGPPGRRFGPVDLAPTDSQFSFAEEHTLIRRPRRAVLREPVNARVRGGERPVSEAIQEREEITSRRDRSKLHVDGTRVPRKVVDPWKERRGTISCLQFKGVGGTQTVFSGACLACTICRHV